MAEIVLSAVINKATEIAANLLLQEGTPLNSLEENINWLQREMRHIRSYIDDAKAKLTEGDSKVENLIKDIEELAGDAEDILDGYIPKIESHKSKGAIGCLKEMSFSCFFFHDSVARKFAMEIEKIKTRVIEIDRVRTTYGITDTRNNSSQHDSVPIERRKLFLHTDETDVIGLDDDFNMLHAKLLDQDLRYGVISIVGMPGLGKTTLAKKLYRHVRDQFECSALVYVSQQPRLGEILLDMAKQVALSEDGWKDDLGAKLRSLFKRKRYVILLDDIWNVEIWDDLKLVLPECDSKSGSRLIITSRNNSVGRYIGEESSLHSLQPLDLKKSFELFTKRMFTLDINYWGNAPPNLKDIGREIVKRCGGIPLAIVVTAGMLRARERSEHEWNKVLESMGQDSKNECAKILTLSYNDLPTTLRPCFLYFGLFPEDHEIRSFDLMNMWIAEKFIVASNGDGREVEDIAEDFLNDLVSRNLIQVSKRTFQGRIARCRVHDLLHDLCVTLAKESNFFLATENTSCDPGVVARQRRLAFYSSGGDEFFPSYPNLMKLRAFLYFSESNYTILNPHPNFNLLRVFFVYNSQNSSGRDTLRIPKEIWSLSCLVYFKLRGLSFSGVMPHDISKLKHLITLDIQETCVRISFDAIMEMKQLRHLRIRRNLLRPLRVQSNLSIRMLSSSTNDAILPNLQTLMWVSGDYMKAQWFHHWTNLRRLRLDVGNESILDLFSTRVALLPKLEVLMLFMEGTELSYFRQINLSSYDNLLKLCLSLEDTKIMNFGALPPNLIKLILSFDKVDTSFMGNIKRLPKLKTLVLLNCEHQIDLSGVGSFPQLEELRIYCSYRLELQEVTVDELGAPKLNKFIVDGEYRGRLKLSKRLAKLIQYK